MLGEETTVNRIDGPKEICRILLAIIPHERGKSMR